MLDVKNIPASLKMDGLWCKYLEEDGKKKPINPKDNTPAKVNDSRTFGTFDEVTRCIGVDILDDKFIESGVDFNLVIEVLKEEYGDKLTAVYIDWLKGYKIKELIEKYGVKSCYYHIDKMTEFIKEFFEVK